MCSSVVCMLTIFSWCVAVKSEVLCVVKFANIGLWIPTECPLVLSSINGCLCICLNFYRVT